MEAQRGLQRRRLVVGQLASVDGERLHAENINRKGTQRTQRISKRGDDKSQKWNFNFSVTNNFCKPVLNMEQKNRILNLLVEGFRPSKIAMACSISIEEVTREIAKAIQERRVQRSCVLATLEKKWQDDIAVWAPAWKQRTSLATAELIYRMLKESSLDDFDLDVEEVKLYFLCFEKAFKDGLSSTL